MRNRRTAPTTRSPRRSSGPPAGTGPGESLRVLSALAGVLLLGLAAVASYGNDYVFAARWNVFLRLPWMAARQYFFLSIWWVIVGLPGLLLIMGLAFRAVRRALRAPWRSAGTAVPLAAVLLFFAASMIPWEFPDTRPEDTGSAMVFLLVVAGSGFALLLAGTHRLLRFLDEPVERTYRWLIGLDRRTFLLGSFGLTFILANLVSLLAFEHMARIPDSVAQLFQARIFASGRLFLDSPRLADFFDYTNIINNGRWYSQYPFLHSLLLVPGVLIGMPWLVNPLLGALTVPAVYLLGRELYDESTGRLAALLGCFTPLLVAMSAEYMNHASALLFATLFLVFYFRTLRQGRWRQAAAAGLFIGLVANVRPYTAAALVLPFAVDGIVRMTRAPGRLVPRFAVMVFVAAATAGLTLIYNRLVNGDPMLFGYIVKWGPGHLLGFGRSGWGAQHTPLRGLVNTGNSLNLANKYLFEWPIPSLLPALLLFAGGTRDRRDWLLAAAFLSLLLAHLFYWFSGVAFGPRFQYESLACLLILTVRGLGSLEAFLRRTAGLDAPAGTGPRFIGRLVPLLLFVASVVGIPGFIVALRGYGQFDAGVVSNVRRTGLTDAVVFCQHFGYGFSANRLDLQGDVVYAKDYGLLNSALTLDYPGRRYYYANKDTLRPLPGIEFEESRLRQALDQMNRELASALAPEQEQDYRTIIWPFLDIPPRGLDLSRPGRPALTDFRALSREMFRGEHVLEDYLPALACWMLNDKREHVQIFSFMDDVQHFIAGGCKFTLMRVTDDGSAAIYDVRAATGDETMVRDRMPVR